MGLGEALGGGSVQAGHLTKKNGTKRKSNKITRRGQNRRAPLPGNCGKVGNVVCCGPVPQLDQGQQQNIKFLCDQIPSSLGVGSSNN